jgi:hypothetical protein
MGVVAEVFSKRRDLLTVSCIVGLVRELGWSVRFVGNSYLTPSPLTDEVVRSASIIGWRPEELADERVDGLIRDVRSDEIERLAEERKLALLSYEAIPDFSSTIDDPDYAILLAREAGQVVADLVYSAHTAYSIENHCLMLPPCSDLQSILQEAIWRETEGIMEDGNMQWRWWGGELPPPPDPEPPESRLTSLWDAWGFGVPIIGQVFALISALAELRLARQEDRTFVEEAEFAKEYLPALEVPMQHKSFVHQVVEWGIALGGNIAGSVALAVVAWPTESLRLILLSSWVGGMVGHLVCGCITRAVLDARERRMVDAVPKMLADAAGDE